MKIILDTSSRTFQTFFTLSLFAFAILLLSTAAYSWTAPTGTAPNSNVAAPVNTGSVSQVKSGPLGVNGFTNDGSSYMVGNLGIGRQPSGDWRIAVDGLNGVYANSNSSYALYGNAPSGYGITGISNSSIGVRGVTDTSYAGYFTSGTTGGAIFAQNGQGAYVYLGYPNNATWAVYTNRSIYAASQVRGDGGFCIGGSCITAWSQAGGGGISQSTTASCSGEDCVAYCPSGYYRTGCSFQTSGGGMPWDSHGCRVYSQSGGVAIAYAYCTR